VRLQPAVSALRDPEAELGAALEAIEQELKRKRLGQAGRPGHAPRDDLDSPCEIVVRDGRAAASGCSRRAGDEPLRRAEGDDGQRQAQQDDGRQRLPKRTTSGWRRPAELADE
jgi:hypothetical protein